VISQFPAGTDIANPEYEELLILWLSQQNTMICCYRRLLFILSFVFLIHKASSFLSVESVFSGEKRIHMFSGKKCFVKGSLGKLSQVFQQTYAWQFSMISPVLFWHLTRKNINYLYLHLELC